MKSLIASIALAAVALPGAAFAAEGEKQKCCCEKMKQEGHDCCDKEGAHKGDEHSGHGEHGQHGDRDQAPAN